MYILKLQKDENNEKSQELHFFWLFIMSSAGTSYWRGRLSTVDLRVLASLNQLLFYIEIIIILFYKTSYLNEEINCTEPSPLVSIPCLLFNF